MVGGRDLRGDYCFSSSPDGTSCSCSTCSSLELKGKDQGGEGAGADTARPSARTPTPLPSPDDLSHSPSRAPAHGSISAAITEAFSSKNYLTGKERLVFLDLRHLLLANLTVDHLANAALTPTALPSLSVLCWSRIRSSAVLGSQLFPVPPSILAQIRAFPTIDTLPPTLRTSNLLPLLLPHLLPLDHHFFPALPSHPPPDRPVLHRRPRSELAALGDRASTIRLPALEEIRFHLHWGEAVAGIRGARD